MAEYKSFYCPRCKQYTRHEKISTAEFGALEEGTMPSFGARLFLGACDYLSEPLDNVIGEFTSKCTQCGLPTYRKLNGDLIKQPRENGKNLDL